MKKTKDKVLTKSKLVITSVQDRDGSIYNFGDKIRIFEKTCKSHNEVCDIIGFRWNKDKTNLCAITNMHNNGIRLDWIEHYIEKVKKTRIYIT